MEACLLSGTDAARLTCLLVAADAPVVPYQEAERPRHAHGAGVPAANRCSSQVTVNGWAGEGEGVSW